ncbi:MAG TPA: serine/threonine-protein kinase [Pyrinomonadaceae bacterium]|nr:serine/threonine-protein kinase [Pyrinomonadaceae bacterium]
MSTSMLLNNRYRIIQTLESGGCGQTYLAEDTHMPSRRRCVIKQLKPATDEPFAYEVIKERFRSEAAILEAIGKASDQIPHLYAYFTENREFYLVQDYIEGKNLKRKVLEEGLFGENDARRFLASLLAVLKYLHSQGIIHRDIKPENVMVRAADGVPVLIDFGAVKEVVTMVSAEGTMNDRSIVIGSPGYMPPEQALGFPVFSSDIYGLGKTVIFALTGKPPQELAQLEYKGTHWTSFAPQVSTELAAVLDRATKPADTDRYASAEEMLRALEVNKTLPYEPPPTPTPRPLFDPPKPEAGGRPTTLTYAALAILAGLFLLTGFYALYANSQRRKAEDNLSRESQGRLAAEGRVRELEGKTREAEARAKKAEDAASSVEQAVREGKVYRASRIENRTKIDINYQFLKGDGTWEQVVIKPGEIYRHWRKNSEVVVKLDYSFEEGYQERRYTLETSDIYGHEPTDEEQDSAVLYYFDNDTSTTLALYTAVGRKKVGF